MKEDFLALFIGSKDRAQLLRAFLFNQTEIFTLAQASKRAGISAKAAEREIKELAKLGLVKKGRSVLVRTVPKAVKGKTKGKKKKGSAGKKELQSVQVAWGLNHEHKQIRSLANFVHEISPVHYDNIVGALKKTGKIAAVILSGSFMGDPSRPADIIVAADSFNERRLEMAIRVLEPAFGREIRYAAFTTPEFRYRLTIQDRLIRDTLDYPHLVLLDKTRLL